MPTPLDVLAEEARGCVRCPLATQGRTQVVFGVGNPDADLMFIGEAPGAEEDKQGFPFVGRSGKLLDKLILEELGLTRDDVYVANVAKCRPPGNRDPLPDEIEACTPWLEQQIELIRPKVVVTLGRFATQYVLQSDESMGKLRGRVHAWRGDTVVVPTFHPSYALRGGGDAVAQMRADLVRAKKALATQGIVLA